MTWDQMQRLKLETEGYEPATIDGLLTRMHSEHMRQFKAGAIDRLPDWQKDRPWGILIFDDDDPLQIVRFVVARSVSGLKTEASNFFTHPAHVHSGSKCLVNKDAAVRIQSDNISSIPVLLARFFKHMQRSKTCDREPQMGVSQIYKEMSRSLNGKVKFVRKLGSA